MSEQSDLDLQNLESSLQKAINSLDILAKKNDKIKDFLLSSVDKRPVQEGAIKSLVSPFEQIKDSTRELYYSPLVEKNPEIASVVRSLHNACVPVINFKDGIESYVIEKTIEFVAELLDIEKENTIIKKIVIFVSKKVAKFIYRIFESIVVNSLTLGAAQTLAQMANVLAKFSSLLKLINRIELLLVKFNVLEKDENENFILSTDSFQLLQLTSKEEEQLQNFMRRAMTKRQNQIYSKGLSEMNGFGWTSFGESVEYHNKWKFFVNEQFDIKTFVKNKPKAPKIFRGLLKDRRLTPPDQEQLQASLQNFEPNFITQLEAMPIDNFVNLGASSKDKLSLALSIARNHKETSSVEQFIKDVQILIYSLALKQDIDKLYAFIETNNLLSEGLLSSLAGLVNKSVQRKSAKEKSQVTTGGYIERVSMALSMVVALKIVDKNSRALQSAFQQKTSSLKSQDNKYKIKQPRDTSLSVISSEIDKAINSIFNEPGREDFKNDVRKFVRTPVLRALKKDLQQAGFNVINERRQVIKLDSTMSVLAGLSSTLTRAGLDSNTILKVRNSVKQAIMTFLRKNKIKSDSLTSRQFKSNSPKDQVRREGRGLLNALLESSNIKDYISVLLNFLGWAKDKGYSIEENDYALIQTLSRQITRLRDPKIKLDKNVVKSVISVIKKLSIANIYKQKIIEKLVEIDKDSRN